MKVKRGTLVASTFENFDEHPHLPHYDDYGTVIRFHCLNHYVIYWHNLERETITSNLRVIDNDET